MLNAKAFANAATIVTAIFYVICLAISYAAPDFVFSISESWLHSINLESLRASGGVSLQTTILGLISISALTWVTTYGTIWLYNTLAKK